MLFPEGEALTEYSLGPLSNIASAWGKSDGGSFEKAIVVRLNERLGGPTMNPMSEALQGTLSALRFWAVSSDEEP